METRCKGHLESDADNKLKEAGEWFLDVASESLTPLEMEKFADWVESDRANREKLDLITSIWSAMDELKDDPMVVRTLEKSKVKERAETEKKWFKDLALYLTKFRYAAVAAALFLIVCGIWLAQQRPNQPEIYKTLTGEQKSVYLSDGSTIYIDTNSAVSTSFTNKFRYIELLEGRVFFSIAHEPARPFIVLTNNVAVRALGTEFEVYKKREDKTTIAVSKGRVQVYQVDKNHGSNVRKGLPVPVVQPTAEQKFLARKSSGNILSSEGLGPGQEIVVYEQNAEYILKSFDLENSSTWREGRLNFQNRPLPEVIEALNRYLINKIIVDDDLKDLNVSVYFEIKNRKEFVATLEKAFPVASRIAPNGQIVLFRRSQDRG